MNKAKSVAPVLLIFFLIFWLALAINPLHRNIWFAENIILIVCISYLVFCYPSYQFSNTSYWLIFVFCILQTIGAHYTYAEVPLGFWVAGLFDIQRNHFDRLVHFAFGFLIVLPFKERFGKIVNFSNRSVETFTLVMIFIGIGASYEILEWWYAVIYEQDSASNMFLGSQGDIWDGEKDVFLAGVGAWLFLAFANTKKKFL